MSTVTGIVLVMKIFQMALVFVVALCTDGFLKAGVYGHELNLVMHDIFDKLRNGKYETLLCHNLTNN